MDTDNKYEEVSKYFPLQEWNNLPEYEKNRFHNLLVNYNKMCELGFSPRKPDFMLSRINKTKTQKLQKERDEEWTPNKVKRPKWNPPRKLAGEVPSVEKKVEDQAFVQFTAADISRSQEIYQCLLQKIAELSKKLGFEDVPEYQLPTQHRYPRRQIERKDYREREVPDDDDYIYCDECEREWEGDCPEHGALVIIPDTEVPDTVNGPDRADKTVPKELCIAQSSIHNAGKGVWTRVLLQKGLRFGPYEGVKVDSPNGEGYCWQIRRNQRISHYVDAWDSSRSNWMRYVNCARHEEEQNLIAFQYKGEMYYRTFRTIRAHVELLVWYGDDFGRELGIDKENYHKPLPAALKSNIFPCISCNTTYISHVYLHNHFKYCRMRTSTPREFLAAPTRNKLVANECVYHWQCNICKGFGNTKDVSFMNSRLKKNIKKSKIRENGTLQLLHTEEKCVERIKNNYASCMDVSDKTRCIPSESAKTFSLKESLNTSKLKFMRDASITSGGPKDNIDILIKRKNITQCAYIYPEERNFKYNPNYRSYTHSGSSMLETQLQECSLAWNTFNLKFEHRNLCKIYKNPSLNYDGLKTIKTSRTPSLSEMSPFTTLESALSIKCERSKVLPVKTGIQKSENINLAFIKKSHKTERSYASNKSLNTSEWPCVCKQCNIILPIASKLHVKERQSAVGAHRSSSKSHKTMINLSQPKGLHPCKMLYSANGLRHREIRRDQRVDSNEKPFECTICDKKFLKKSYLVRHQRIHSGENPYECNVCDKKFTQKIQLVFHQKIHSGERPLECPFCEKKFYTKSDLDRHKRFHSGERPLECSICEKKFYAKRDMNKHKRIHSGERSFECSICEKKFYVKCDLDRHKRIHSDERPLECSICEKKIYAKSDLNRHKRIHSGMKSFECSICEMKFNRKGNLVRHQRIHSDNRPFECSICEKKFCTKKDLDSHKIIHSDERPFECSICEKKFYAKSNLITHNRIHSGEKPFECSICEKKFYAKSNLITHYRIHSGEKPFECSICEMKFKWRSSLVSHQRFHSDDRPFGCSICGKKFFTKSELGRHNRIHSVEKPFEC